MEALPDIAGRSARSYARNGSLSSRSSRLRWEIGDAQIADGSHPTQWAVVSDLGGVAEVNSFCPGYGGPYCSYPWFAANSAVHAVTYGADYAGTKLDYGQGLQFATTPLCGGPFGPDSTFCDTTLTPSPSLK